MINLIIEHLIFDKFQVYSEYNWTLCPYVYKFTDN